MSKKLLLSFDLSTLLYRSYHSKSTDSIQLRTIKWIMEAIEKFSPSHLAICLDERDRDKLYRRRLYKEYKLNRSEKPKEIIEAEDEIIEFCNDIGVRYIRVDGNECDDVCASIQKLCKTNKADHIHITQDGDLTSLYVDKNFKIAKLTKNSVKLLRNWKDVQENFKKITISKPEMVRECLAIQNDASDNIYGLPRYGKVKSSRLIEEWKTIPNIYDNLDKFEQKTRELLEVHREKLFLNRKLIKLHNKLDVGVLSDYEFTWDYDKAFEYVLEHNIENKLYKNIESISFDF